MRVTMYCDGGTVGDKNPADAVYWSVSREHDDGRIEKLIDRAISDEFHTNNCAEYLALEDALLLAQKIPALTHLTVCSDSELIVRQFNGRYKCKNHELKRLLASVRLCANRLSDSGVSVEVRWVHRAANVERLGH